MKTYTVKLLHKAQSPITHMSGTSGNEAIINREEIFNNGVKLQIPILSGNALRHSMIREPSAYYLMIALGLEHKLSIDQLYFMVNGGSLSESSITTNLKIIADMKRLFPLYKILGGSLRNQIIAGSMNFGRGYLVCKETQDKFERYFKGYIDKEFTLRSLMDYVGKYQYTRHDAKKKRGIDYFLEAENLEKKDDDKKEKSNQMIYNGESIVQGSIFMQKVILNNVDELDVGCFLHSVFLWQKSGGIVGGLSRIGHGELKTSVHIEGVDPIDYDGLVNNYIEHMNDNKDECVEFLNTCFPKAIDKKAMAKKKSVKKKKDKETTKV